MIEVIDVERLIQSARDHCCKEAYLVLLKNGTVRIGAGARVDREEPDLFIDLTVNLCAGDNGPNVAQIERAAKLARQLRSIGYALVCQEGSISCEKTVQASKMNDEYKAIQHIIRELKIIS